MFRRMYDHRRGLARQGRTLLALALPLIGSNLAQIGLHATDSVMMGWYSVSALAATVLAASSFFLLFILGAGFATAVMPLVAAAAAVGDDTEVRRATRMGLWHSLIFSVLVLPLFWYSGAVLTALGQKPQVAATAQDFLRIAGFGMAPALIVAVLRSYLSAMEHARIVLWATLVGLVANALLDWMLIFGHWGAPEMGVRGSATATLATQLMTLAVVAGYCLRHPQLRSHALFTRFWRPDWAAYWAVLRLGLPIGITSLSEGGLFSATALMMGWIGTVPLAAHGIAIEWASLAFMVHLGLSQAVTVRVGRAHGAGDAAAMRQTAGAAMLLSFGFGLATMALFVLFPGPLVGLFVRADDPLAPQILRFGGQLLAIAALFQLADAAQVLALGMLRGVQDTRVPMLMTAVAYWAIGIPASYTLAFPLRLGGVGLWLGLVVGLMVAAALLLRRFWRGRLDPPPSIVPA